MTLCDCHSAPCFKVFQSNLYSVLEFDHLLYFKIQKLFEKYMYYCICYYLAELLHLLLLSRIVSCYNLECRPKYEKTFYRVLTVLYKIKKIYFWLIEAPCSAGALGPGLAGLCLNTALPVGICTFELSTPHYWLIIALYSPGSLSAIEITAIAGYF